MEARSKPLFPRKRETVQEDGGFQEEYAKDSLRVRAFWTGSRPLRMMRIETQFCAELKLPGGIARHHAKDE
jgi:hypothetical protein